MPGAFLFCRKYTIENFEKQQLSDFKLIGGKLLRRRDGKGDKTE
jgi:hypothetical protein